jgi:hypothetical protein
MNSYLESLNEYICTKCMHFKLWGFAHDVCRNEAVYESILREALRDETNKPV